MTVTAAIRTSSPQGQRLLHPARQRGAYSPPVVLCGEAPHSPEMTIGGSGNLRNGPKCAACQKVNAAVGHLPHVRASFSGPVHAGAHNPGSNKGFVELCRS